MDRRIIVGAFIGMQLLMRRPEISGWVSVAPPANHYDFGSLAPCPCGGLMLHGDADELVPEGAVRKLVDKLNTQKGVTSITCSRGMPITCSPSMPKNG